MDKKQAIQEIARQDSEQLLLFVASQAEGAAFRRQAAVLFGDDVGYVGELLNHLRDLGLVDGEGSLAGEIELTGLGRQVAREINSSLKSGSRRSHAVRRAVLERAVAEEARMDAGQLAMSWPPSSTVTPPSQTEAEHALEYLKEEGYIEVIETGSGLILDGVTARGRDAFHDDHALVHQEARPVTQDHRNQSVNASTIQGPVQTGDRNIQHAIAIVPGEQIVQLRALLEQAQRALAQIPPNDREAIEPQLQGVADDLVEDSGPIRRVTLTERLTQLLVTSSTAAVGTAAGAELVHIAGQMLQLIR